MCIFGDFENATGGWCSRHDSEKIWKTHLPRCPQKYISSGFLPQMNSFAFNIKWNNWVNHWHRWWLYYKFLCSIFSKGKQSFDFIKRNVIRKLAYKVKYINQINVGLIMFYGNSRIRFCQMSWFNCEQYGKNQYKKKE